MVRRMAPVVAVFALALTGACGSGTPGETTGDDNATGAAADWEPEYVDGVLQPLPDGFPENTLHLINPDVPGHDDGLYIRAMQSALEGISPVDVTVEDMGFPTFGTWAGIQHMQNQRGGTEGYYAMVTAMTGAGMDLLTEPIEAEFGMTLDDLQPVIATERTPFVMVTRADAPWDSYEELVEAAKADPGSLRYIATVGSQLDIAMTRLMSEGGWQARKIPAGGSEEAATVVAAGEGDFTMLTPSVARTHEQAGRVKTTLVVSPEKEAPEGYPDAVTTAAIGLPDEPWGSLRGFVVAPEIDELHRAWLYELFRAGSKQDAYVERVEKLPGATRVDLGEDAVRREIESAVKFAEPIVKDLGLLADDN